MNKCLKLTNQNKAKEDMDVLMQRMGFANVAVGSDWRGSVSRFFAKLLSVLVLPLRLRRDDVLLIQYPFKKYYALLCKIAHLRGARVVTLIHDLGCFRRHKLTPEGEVRLLSHSDVLIVHNTAMHQFLAEHHYPHPIVELGIFDYLSDCQPSASPVYPQDGVAWEVVYAGGLAKRKSTFIYMLDKVMDGSWQFIVHGNGLDEDEARTWQHVSYGGFMKSDDFISRGRGHFGLVWDGISIDECAGPWGEYLRINNPHKTSFYLRAGKPVIMWSQSALAPFVVGQGAGIIVDSLSQIGERLAQLSPEQYTTMCQCAARLGQQLQDGHYLQQSFTQAVSYLK